MPPFGSGSGSQLPVPVSVVASLVDDESSTVALVSAVGSVSLLVGPLVSVDATLVESVTETESESELEADIDADPEFELEADIEADIEAESVVDIESVSLPLVPVPSAEASPSSLEQPAASVDARIRNAGHGLCIPPGSASNLNGG